MPDGVPYSNAPLARRTTDEGSPRANQRDGRRLASRVEGSQARSPGILPDGQPLESMGRFSPPTAKCCVESARNAPRVRPEKLESLWSHQRCTREQSSSPAISIEFLVWALSPRNTKLRLVLQTLLLGSRKRTTRITWLETGDARRPRLAMMIDSFGSFLMPYLQWTFLARLCPQDVVIRSSGGDPGASRCDGH